MSTQPFLVENLSHAAVWIGSGTPALENIAAWSISSDDTVWLTVVEQGGMKEVRAFMATMATSPRSGSIRLGVITGGEQLSHEAQSALLKLLEEPPPRARVVIMATTEASLLPTLLSRCRIWYGDTPAAATTALFAANALERFLASETLAKDPDIMAKIAGELIRVQKQWAAAGWSEDGLARVEKIWHLYHNLETQMNKRLLLERDALDAAKGP